MGRRMTTSPSLEDERFSPVFPWRLVANEEDVDWQGHVSNLVYVRWVQDATRAHSDAVGLDFDAYRSLGAVFVVRRHEVEYLRPAFAGENIRVETWVESVRAATSLRRTRIFREKDGAELCRALTRWAFIDFETGRPRRISEPVRTAFAGGWDGGPLIRPP